MTALAYEPASGFTAKVQRRLSRYVARDMVEPHLTRGMISLSFDDCPRSVVENALPQIEDKGWRATIYASMGLCGTTNHLGLHMSEEDMIQADAKGHEIGDHTFSHIDGLQQGPDEVLADIARNRMVFEAIGLPRAETFAYPYGEVTPSLKRVLQSEFVLSRGIHGPSGSKLDLGLAASGRLYSDEMDETIRLIDEAAQNRRWLILFGHDVRENPSEYGCTPEELARILDRIAHHDLDVLPVRDALKQVQS